MRRSEAAGVAETCDVVVVGGGISGTAAAYELARAGASVLLVERASLASMASGWTLAGVRQSGRHPAELPLAMAAVRRWEGLSAELGADVEYRQHGNLRLARTEDEVPVIEALVAQQRGLGLHLELLPDNRAVRAVAPALAESILAASFCPTDGHANPTAAVDAFAAAAQRHGARLLLDTTVTDIEVGGDRVRGVQTTRGPISAGTVVIAAGVYSGRLCAQVGLDLPIEVRHTTVVQTVPLPPLLRPVLGVATGAFAGRQEVGGSVRFTGRGEAWCWPDRPLRSADVQPPAQQVAWTIERGVAVLPVLADARINRVWGGLLDVTPDALPVIERVPELDGLILAAGFSGHGFCLGPITGQIIRELATSGVSSLPLEPFSRRRFAEPVAPGAVELHG
jgi:sarcosine oxidase, subunit beta